MSMWVSVLIFVVCVLKASESYVEEECWNLISLLYNTSTMKKLYEFKNVLLQTLCLKAHFYFRKKKKWSECINSSCARCLLRTENVIIAEVVRIYWTEL